jgi:hypothetical protein
MFAPTSGVVGALVFTKRLPVLLSAAIVLFVSVSWPARVLVPLSLGKGEEDKDWLPSGF